jgi:hypothetical protein
MSKHLQAIRAVAETEPVPGYIPLAGRHTLAIEKSPTGNTLQLRGKDGKVCISIEVTEKGAVLRFEGPSLSLQTTGELSIEADSLSITTRKNISLTTQGSLQLNAQGDLRSHARTQHIVSDYGNVNLKANDDVRLNGERVLVNCVET